MSGPITIVKGSDAKVTASLIDKDTKQPVPLVNFTSCTGYFPKEDISVQDAVIKVGTLISQDLGRVQFLLDENDTDALKSGEGMGVEVRVDLGAAPTGTRLIAQFDGGLTVKDRLFTSF